MVIDSHCHLPHKKYPKDLAQVISDAQAAGVGKFISVGTSLSENLHVLDVAERYPDVYCALAIYPHEDRDQTLDTLRQELARQLKMSTKIVAVGECGLDITEWEGGRYAQDQIDLFEMQLALAIEHKLPLILHNRGGDDLVFDILKPYVAQGLSGVAHCFSSDQEVAQRYLDFNFYLSFSAMITYKGRETLRSVAAWAPLDRILVETDAPYLPPQHLRGQINEPKNVVEVAKKLAEIRKVDYETVAEATYSNTVKLFNLH
jgi:TatD DNase family protein